MKTNLKLKFARTILFSVLFIISYVNVAFPQGAAINTTGTSADPSAMLDVSATDAGVLIPRMTEAQKNSISFPAIGLMIYQTNGTAGFWYYNGAIWVQAIGPAGPTGATGPLTPGTSGQTLRHDGNTWVANNTLYNNGTSVGIGTTSPNQTAMLDVSSTDKGVLIPRVDLTGTASSSPISSPQISLIVYNQATTNDVTPGFYFWDGSKWNRFNTGTPHYEGELYGGGVVFYVDGTGQHGLICSMIDLGTSKKWSNVSSTLIGSTAQSSWNGQGNTTAIINQSGHSTSAAKLCDQYTNVNYGTGVYSDWYLPAIYEMSLLYHAQCQVNKALDSDGNGATTILSRSNYWTSTENTYMSAWYYNFDYNGSSTNYMQTGAYSKDTQYYVRAIRAF